MQRASFEELLDFANKVRAAGGGNPLDALMPAAPADPTKCLIAKNLNFNCTVQGCVNGDSENSWSMYVEDAEIARKIAATLDLPYFDNSDDPIADESEFNEINLPEHIGAVARDFDNAFDALRYDIQSAEMKELVKEMWPYIDAATREAFSLGPVNERGEIIL